MSSVPCGMGNRGDGMDASSFYASAYRMIGRRSRCRTNMRSKTAYAVWPTCSGLAGHDVPRGSKRRRRWGLGVPLRRRSSGLRLALAFYIERHGGADEVLQCRLVEAVIFVNVDGAADVAFEAGVEQACGVF